ncbi:MAG: MBL fold metallo-hydrolase, partial [Cellvibrionaceae bacterium]|nr:MBL fold metallo-hydrolase [Cellvibrionaceae bacterium]
HHQLVYDVGRNFSERFDSGEHIVAPYLLRLGYSEIDRLLISHGDSDHAGGVLGLQRLIAVDDVVAGEPEKSPGKQCVRGQHWHWDDVHFTVLWPSAEFLQHYKPGRKNDTSNNLSCVLHIHYRDQAILLTGDIENTVERRLLDTLAPVTILLAPHHGSNTSSHSAWLAQLQAEYVVFSAGYHSPYGHPHPEVVKRYQQTGASLFDTGKDGAIRFTFAPGDPNKHQPWQLERWRLDYGRYWYSAGEAIDSNAL